MNADSRPAVVDHCASAEPVRSRGRLVAGCLAVGITVLGSWMYLGLRHYTLEHNFHHDIDSPVLAVELASNSHELESVLNPPSAAEDAKTQSRAALQTNTYEDCLFIVLYSLFLWTFADLFAGPDKVSTVSRRILAVVIIATALCDYAENLGIFRALRARQITDALAQQVCWPSRCKWLSFGGALLITAILLLRSDREIYSLATRRLLAIAYAAAGLLIVTGSGYPPFIQLGVNVFALIVVINLVALLGAYVSEWIPPTIPEFATNFCDEKKAVKPQVAVRVKHDSVSRRDSE